MKKILFLLILPLISCQNFKAKDFRYFKVQEGYFYEDGGSFSLTITLNNSKQIVTCYRANKELNLLEKGYISIGEKFREGPILEMKGDVEMAFLKALEEWLIQNPKSKHLRTYGISTYEVIEMFIHVIKMDVNKRSSGLRVIIDDETHF